MKYYFVGETIKNELQTEKELFDELLMRNENFFSKCNSLMEDHKNIKENWEKLTTKNTTLQKNIKNLQEGIFFNKRM